MGLSGLDKRGIIKQGANKMPAFGRITWIGQVWLTAVLTLVAGVPRLECRCPNGNIKPFCLGSTRNSSGCCCGGACYSSTPGRECCCQAPMQVAAEETQIGSCCCHQNQETSRLPSDHPKVGNCGCTRSLAQLKVVTLSPGKQVVGKDLTVRVILPPQTNGAFCLAVRVTGRRHGQMHPLAPPTDLVTQHQRLVI